MEKSVDAVRAVLPEIADISDPQLRAKVENIWLQVWKESEWDNLADVPKNVGKDNGIKLLVHVRSVIRISMAMADSIAHFHGVKVDQDRLLAATILHDVDKVLLYAPNGSKSPMYKALPHTLYTAHKMLEHGLDHELVNMVITHSENHCTKAPMSVEAMILKHGDHGESEAVRMAVDVLGKVNA